MYYGRKKGIIIAIIVVAIILLVGIVGTCLYMFTDLFKSNEKLFWKYMSKQVESIGITPNTQMQEIQKKKQQNPYITNGKVEFSSTNNEINNNLEKVKLISEGKTDKSNNYAYSENKLEYSNSTIFNLKYVHDEDIYALKSDEIVNVYVGVRNKNLNVLMQKLGITLAFDIPDEIVPIDYSSIYNLTQEEENHLKETYSNVIMQNITKDCYSRQTEAVVEKDGVSYTTTSYRLDLSSDLISDITLNILNTLKTDTVTLNLIASKASGLGIEEYATVDGVINGIDNIINNLENVNFVDTSFVVYSYKGETIMTEVLLKNTSKTTIYTGNSIKIKYENFEDDAEFNVMNIEIVSINTFAQSGLNIKANVDDETEVTLDISNTGSAVEGNLNTNITGTVMQNEEIYEFVYTGTTEFVNELENIEELNETNCAILNDYSQQDLNTLMQALMNQIITVFNQKAQMIGISNTVVNPTPQVTTDQNPETTNNI
ncbi:MAG: hypothetical protein HFJ41_06110 [Clostridia bacterium]|nr:hypothetical protein [Clostridia bacterium]